MKAKQIESDNQKVIGFLTDLARLRKKLDGTIFPRTALIFGLARLYGQLDCLVVRLPHCRSVLTSIDALILALASLRPPVSLPQRAAVASSIDALSESLRNSEP